MTDRQAKRQKLQKPMTSFFAKKPADPGKRYYL